MPLSIKDELAALRNRGVVVKSQQTFSSRSAGVTAKTPESYAKLVQDNQAAMKRKDSMQGGGVGMETQYFLERNSKEKSAGSAKVTEIPSSHYMYNNNSSTETPDYEEKDNDTRTNAPVTIKREKQPPLRTKSNNAETDSGGICISTTARTSSHQINNNNKNDEAANMQDAAQHDIETIQQDTCIRTSGSTPNMDATQQQPRATLSDTRIDDNRMKEEEEEPSCTATTDDDVRTPEKQQQQQSTPQRAILVDHDHQTTDASSRMKEEEEEARAVNKHHDATQHQHSDNMDDDSSTHDDSRTPATPPKDTAVITNKADETKVLDNTTEEPTSDEEDSDEEAPWDTLTNDDDDETTSSSVDDDDDDTATTTREPISSCNDEEASTNKRTLRRTNSGREYTFDKDGFRIFWT